MRDSTRENEARLCAVIGLHATIAVTAVAYLVTAFEQRLGTLGQVPGQEPFQIAGLLIHRYLLVGAVALVVSIWLLIVLRGVARRSSWGRSAAVVTCSVLGICWLAAAARTLNTGSSGQSMVAGYAVIPVALSALGMRLALFSGRRPPGRGMSGTQYGLRSQLRAQSRALAQPSHRRLTPTLRPLATGWARVTARVTDALVYLTTFSTILVLDVLFSGEPRPTALSPTFYWLGCVAILLYEAQMIAIAGQTPGKMLLGIQVRGLDGNLAPISSALLRTATLLFAAALPWITLLIHQIWLANLLFITFGAASFLISCSFLLDGMRRGFQDKIAKTVVIAVKTSE